MTGSYMTWLLEKRFNIPNWVPNDLDICCISKKQFENIQQILEPLATDINETNWLAGKSVYWTIDEFKYQAFVHTLPVQKRLDIVDYTITSIASDGKNYITGKKTIEDIANKVIRLNDKIFNWPVDSIMYRYTKYIDRGYKDINNDTLTKLKQLYKV